MSTAAVIKSGLLCPLCRDGGTKVHLLAKIGEGYYCEAGIHRFNDTEQVMMLNPERIKLPPPPPKVQAGRVTMQVQVPATLRDALNSKFGVKLEASVNAILGALLEPNAFVVSGVDQQRLCQLAGKEIRNSIDFYSAFYEKRIIFDEQNKELERLKASTGPRLVEDPSTVKVVLPSDIVETVKSKAEFNGMNIGNYIASVLSFAIKNEWV